MPARRWLYVGGFLVSGVLLLSVAAMAVVDGLSALSGTSVLDTELLLLRMLAAAIEWVLAGLFLALLCVLFLTAAVVSVLRSASLPRDDRLAAFVDRLERRFPALRQFDARERVEPTTEDRKRRLKQRYVEGELDDDEFEREMERLLDDDSEAR